MLKLYSSGAVVKDVRHIQLGDEKKNSMEVKPIYHQIFLTLLQT